MGSSFFTQEAFMRYHYRPPLLYISTCGETYICNHPAYSRCTLYRKGELGLAVIQQRYDPEAKKTWWTEIDPELTDVLYLHERFDLYFEKKAGVKNSQDLYPTVTVRQLMWGLKMKPLKREPWETVFDKSPF